MPAAVACPGGGPARKLRHVQRVRPRRVRESLSHPRAAAPLTAPRRPPASWAGRACGVRSAERRSCSHPAGQGGGCTSLRRQIRAAPCLPFPTWDPPPAGRARRCARRRLAARRGRSALLRMRPALQGCGRCRVCSFNKRRSGDVRFQREGAAGARESVGTRAAVYAQRGAGAIRAVGGRAGGRVHNRLAGGAHTVRVGLRGGGAWILCLRPVSPPCVRGVRPGDARHDGAGPCSPPAGFPADGPPRARATSPRAPRGCCAPPESGGVPAAARRRVPGDCRDAQERYPLARQSLRRCRAGGVVRDVGRAGGRGSQKTLPHGYLPLCWRRACPPPLPTDGAAHALEQHGEHDAPARDHLLLLSPRPRRGWVRNASPPRDDAARPPRAARPR
mmetsp:Transcript_28208/g.66870  ORF Transcript_28208/g.66870 Transcript_28208/m.66870 type:complete len:390 (-) Transcript_28208:400-1569(-)